MTTDITKLAQRLKAAAEKLDGAHWQTRKGFSGIEVIVKGSLEKRSGFTSFQPVAADLADSKTAKAIALFSPANVIALVEALEKAQRHANLTEAERQAYLGLISKRDERIAELESRTVTVKLPPLNDDLIAILGRPNFMCAHLAELLRKSGEDIKRKAEHEQAAIIHWFLSIYLEHGDKWEGIAKSDIQARAAGIKVEAE